MKLRSIPAIRKSDTLDAQKRKPPDWDDLRGRAPDATGDLSSEAFVRKLRSEWPDPQAEQPEERRP